MRSKKDNTIYAIKKLVKNNVQSKDFLRETEIMKYLNHENIIKFYGYFEDKENINKYKEIFPRRQRTRSDHLLRSLHHVLP